MICSDIDGTLLDENRFVSEWTQKAFRQVTKEHNAKAILVSARMPKAMRYLQTALSINEPIIAYNGALVIDALDNEQNAEILHDVSMKHAIIKAIYEKASGFDLHISLFSYDDWHTNRIDWGTKREIEHTRVLPNTVDNLESILNSYVSLEKTIHKVMCIGDAEKMDILEDFLRTNFAEELNIYRSKDTYLEINPKVISKATALELLQTHFNFERKEIIAFGDNYNDIEMLAYAGVGVAVENAREEVKSVADFITGHHKSNGVAKALAHFFRFDLEKI
jgi:Cof subfamily protein (haloacid dehalogenase superfamily)